MSILANILNIQVNTHLLDNYCFYCVIYGATHFDEVSQYCKDGNTRAERVIETFKEDCCTLSDDVETGMIISNREIIVLKNNQKETETEKPRNNNGNKSRKITIIMFIQNKQSPCQ